MFSLTKGEATALKQRQKDFDKRVFGYRNEFMKNLPYHERMGGADAPSGFYIKDAKTSATICGPTASAGADTDVFFEQQCDLSSAAGKMVYIFIQDKNAATATFGKVLIDDIHFIDVNGNILGNARYFKEDTRSTGSCRTRWRRTSRCTPSSRLPPDST